MTDRELDALVAERVFGVIDPCVTDTFSDAPEPLFQIDRGHALRSEPYPIYGQPGKWGRQWHFFRPSTSGDGMLLVVERMRALGWDFELGSDVDEMTSCDFMRPDYSGEPEPGKRGFAFDASMAKAACLAALRALGVEIPG